MQTPPVVEGGQRRPLSELSDVVIHDTDEGVVLVADHRDPRQYTLKFDFSTSQNLKVSEVGEKVEQPDPMKVTIVLEPNTVRNICYLVPLDRKTATSFEMRYRVQCLARNPKTGQLEQVVAPSRKPAPPPSAAPDAQKESAPAKKESPVAAKPEAKLEADPNATVEGTERKVITDTLTLVIEAMSDHGYNLVFESTDVDPIETMLDLTSCENLSMILPSNVQKVGDMQCLGDVEPRSNLPIVRLVVTDMGLGSCGLGYKVRHRKDPAKRKLREEEEAKKKAEDEAKKKADEEAQAELQKKIEDELKKLEAEEAVPRHRIEVEWRGGLALLERKFRASICSLCRGFIKKEQEVHEYKQFRVHQTCFDRCPKCDYCHDILIGEYVVTKGDVSAGIKLHKECIDPYKHKSRPVCVKCNQQIMDERWATTADGKTYHSTCRQPSQAPT